MNGISRFNIINQIGKGSFSKTKTNIGNVFQAFDKQLNKQVALKAEKPDKVKTFRSEFKILSLLQGNIC